MFAASTDDATTLTAQQQDICRGYLNKHYKSTLIKFADAFSKLGTEMAKARTCSGRSYSIAEATLTEVNVMVE